MEAKLHAEVDGLLSDEIPSFDDLTTLVYAKQIIDETLRLYPPVCLFSRRAITEDHIDGYYIAPGSDVFMAPYFVQRHPQFWRIHKHSDRSALSRMRSVNAISLLIFPFPWVSDGASGGSLLWWRCRIHLGAIAKHLRLRCIPERPIELEPYVNLRTRHSLHMIVERR
ncbi:MAG: cytochrome P450 [Pseudomonadota bacterium]|nr:cytochrome P450 [Pseudomonadota bacterium]